MSCPLTKLRWKLTLSCALLALAASMVHAQDSAGGIRWRTDYATARKEAEAKKLPLLIDFTKEACAPCARMERETFPDPRIVNMVNQHFIPLKSNYSLDSNLANGLGISLFPTLVTAASDGHILKLKVGLQSAEELQEMMQQTLALVTPPDAMRDKLVAAKKFEVAGDYSRAINALRDILDDGKPRAIHKDAQELLKKIEKRADERLAQAKELRTKGKSVEALEICTEIVGLFPGMPAARAASELIRDTGKAQPEIVAVSREKRARELITQAQDFYKSKDYLVCLDRCRIILANYGDLPEGNEAHVLHGKIQNNREWLQNAADSIADRLGEIWLALADTCLKQGDVRKAQYHLQRVIHAFPGSQQAESAQIRLSQLQGTVPAGNTQRP